MVDVVQVCGGSEASGRPTEHNDLSNETVLTSCHSKLVEA